MDQLPAIVVLAVLLGIFLRLRRHSRPQRLRLCVLAWALVLVHFCAQVLEPLGGRAGAAAGAISMAALGLAGVAFVVSLLRSATTAARQRLMLLVAGLPLVLYCTALAFSLDSPLLYLACLAAVFFGTVAVYAPMDRFVFGNGLPVVAVVVGAGALAIWRALDHDYGFGLLTMMTVTFAAPALLVWRRYRRTSIGVATMAVGFLGWGAAFPAAAWLGVKLPGLHLNPDLWNVPKLLVAFGMILATLEDVSARENLVKRQLEQFSGLISKMLSGFSAGRVCDEVAAAIVETSPFDRTYILLRSPQGLTVAGARGLAEEDLARLRREAPRWSPDDLAKLTTVGTRLGACAFRFEPHEAEYFDLAPSRRGYEDNPHWKRGCRVLILLPSRRGGYLGCVALDEPRDVDRVTIDELSRIELLAADLAIAIEGEELQQQLVNSEKMAAMGRLVAGVAHELNNPLTAVLGYADLLTQDTDGAVQQQVSKLMREALRMKRIIANLLVFSRQDRSRRKEANLEQVLREVIALREYHLQALGVRLETDIDPDLPPVPVDEDHLRQILLNLLNNAVDAVADTPEKLIRMVGSRKGERVTMRIEDSGTGFADIHRALDPFFTTKPVGKGTGLGLSICYGIVRDLGGEVRLQNLEPRGAAVTLDLPTASAFYAVRT